MTNRESRDGGNSDPMDGRGGRGCRSAHVKERIACQDCVGTADTAQVVAVALADGAGSAKLAEEGVRITVATFLKLVVESFDQLRAHSAAAAETVVRSVRTELNKTAALTGATVSDYASTLLFAATDARGFVAGQLGDGMVAVQRGDGTIPLFEPVRGEYKNETIFVTSPDATRLFSVVTGECDSVMSFVLMSDGSAESLYHRPTRSFAHAVCTLAGWLDNHSPAA